MIRQRLALGRRSNPAKNRWSEKGSTHPTGEALLEELLWVHGIIRSNLDTIKGLIEQVAGGAPASQVRAQVEELASSSVVWRLRVDCMRSGRLNCVQVVRNLQMAPPGVCLPPAGWQDRACTGPKRLCPRGDGVSAPGYNSALAHAQAPNHAAGGELLDLSAPASQVRAQMRARLHQRGLALRVDCMRYALTHHHLEDMAFFPAPAQSCHPAGGRQTPGGPSAFRLP